MKKSIIPFDIELLYLKASSVKNMGRVKDLRIFVSSTSNFNPEGLFSTEIFGNIGTIERNTVFGYIDMGVEIIHPALFKVLRKLKRLYGDILARKAYAIFNEDTQDFELSNASDGQTGFAFFLKHVSQLKLKPNKSPQRTAGIKLFEKYRNDFTMCRYLLVLPAGLRDYTVSDTGVPSEDEVNTFYRKVLNGSTVAHTVQSPRDEDLDGVRYNIQLAVFQLYEYLRSANIDGKHKFAQGNWGKRAIFAGTRNVITALPNTGNIKNAPETLSFNETGVGLFQYAEAIRPKTIHGLVNTFLSNVFTSTSLTARLINKQSMLQEYIEVKQTTLDKWFTSVGLTDLLGSLSKERKLSKPVVVDKHYLKLIYFHNKEIMLLDNITDLKEGLDPKYVRPITYAELLYLSIYDTVGKYPALLTRYPVTGLGSTYPTLPKVFTTTETYSVTSLDTGKIYDRWPVLGERFFNSLAPHNTHLAKLGADFDGDTVSFTVAMLKESRDEIFKLLNSPEYYLDTGGRIAYSADDDVISTLSKYATM